MEIIPAIIPKSFDDLKNHLDLVFPYVKSIQIDVTDGIFAGGKSWPYSSPNDQPFNAILGEEDGLPHWEDLQFEIDLMVVRPEVEFERWVTAGVGRLVFHFESMNNPGALINDVERKYGEAKENPLSPEIGIAFENKTPLEEIFPLMHKVSFIQLMGIEKIGYQGQPFDEAVLRRIETLRARDPKLVISVDGGVGRETAPRLVAAGANRLVVGSAIFKSKNIKEEIEWFQGL